MRITGTGSGASRPIPAEAIRTLRRTRELGINFIDTADSYGPDVSERLIRRRCTRTASMRIATKAGLARTGPTGGSRSGGPSI